MNLALPVVTVTLGPTWASQLNAALEVIDTHDHSSGKGVKITPAGFNVNADLDFNGFALNDLQKAALRAQISALSGASNANAVYSVAGDLYFTNGSGVAIQLTTGGSIVTAPSATNLFQYNNLSTNLSIAAVDTFVVLGVDTSAARTIDLPSAAAVSAGRIYVIKDATGQSETNAITLNADGSDTIDGSSSLSIQNNWSSTFVIGNGVDCWHII